MVIAWTLRFGSWNLFAVTACRQVDVFERQRFFVELFFLANKAVMAAGVFPGSGVAEVGVVAFGFVVFGLVLFAEVASAGFFASQRIVNQQLAEFQEVSDSAGAFEVLIERFSASHHADVAPELVAEHRRSLARQT